MSLTCRSRRTTVLRMPLFGRKKTDAPVAITGERQRGPQVVGLCLESVEFGRLFRSTEPRLRRLHELGEKLEMRPCDAQLLAGRNDPLASVRPDRCEQAEPRPFAGPLHVDK